MKDSLVVVACVVLAALALVVAPSVMVAFTIGIAAVLVAMIGMLVVLVGLAVWASKGDSPLAAAVGGAVYELTSHVLKDTGIQVPPIEDVLSVDVEEVEINLSTNEGFEPLYITDENGLRMRNPRFKRFRAAMAEKQA